MNVRFDTRTEQLPPLWAAHEERYRRVASDILAAIAAGLALSPTSVGVELQGDGARRYARLLHTAGYDAWLVEWDPAAELGLHDHGGSIGAFHVVEGALIEAYSDLTLPHPIEHLRVPAGGGRHITASRVHRVWNPGPGTAVSVHVYSPPLTTMTFFDDHPDRFLSPLRTETVEGAP